MDLNEIMQFDHVVTVDYDGNVTDGPTWLHAPNLLDDELDSLEWSLLNGYSGQSGYRGPIMHNSEFIGGRMASDIISSPGHYVAVVAHWTPENGGVGTGAEGWAVARYCTHSWVAGIMVVHPEDLATVAGMRHVECQWCERVARLGQDF